MASFSCAVVAHYSRIVAATELARTVGGVIVMDSGDIGCNANHLRAWEMISTREADYGLVLEDDAQPVPGFVEQAEQALAVAPEPVVSLYLGTGRPVRWQERIPSAIAAADRIDACWLTTMHTIHAVALAIHTDHREDWLDFAHDSKLPIDERMSAWCVARGHSVAYTWPSLVDHADGPTLIKHRDGRPRNAPRRAWRTGTHTTWTSTAVSM